MPSPFFSGRIPVDLNNRINQHVAETGESKTQILINALAAYLNYPVKMQSAAPSSGVSLEMFTALVERVAALEQLLPSPETTIIASDNNSNIVQPTVVNGDNSFDKSSDSDNSAFISLDIPETLSDPWLDTATTTPNPDNLIDKTDNNTATPVIKLNENTLLLAPPSVAESQIQLDNIDNTTKTSEPQQPKLFNESEEIIGPYSETRMAQELGLDRNKLRKHTGRIEKGEISTNTPLEVMRGSQLYHLEYQGKPQGKPQGRKLWKAKLVEPES
jgi:hypothetical protein